MNDEDDAPEQDEFCLLPENTIVFEADEANRVTIQFPSQSDAIIFHEFLRAFIANEIALEVVKL